MRRIAAAWALTRVLVRRQFTGGRKRGDRVIAGQITNLLKS